MERAYIRKNYNHFVKSNTSRLMILLNIQTNKIIGGASHLIKRSSEKARNVINQSSTQIHLTNRHIQISHISLLAQETVCLKNNCLYASYKALKEDGSPFILTNKKALIFLHQVAYKQRRKNKELSISLSQNSELVVSIVKMFISKVPTEYNEVLGRYQSDIVMIFERAYNLFLEGSQKDIEQWEIIYELVWRYNFESPGCEQTTEHVQKISKSNISNKEKYELFVASEQQHQDKFRKLMKVNGCYMPEKNVKIQPNWKELCLSNLEKFKVKVSMNENNKVISNIELRSSHMQKKERLIETESHISEAGPVELVFKDQNIPLAIHTKYLVHQLSKKQHEEEKDKEQKDNFAAIKEKLSKVVCGTIQKYYYDIKSETLFSEYCRYNSLKQFLKQTGKFMSFRTKLWLFYTVAEGLAMIFDQNILHGNIRSNNILVGLGLFAKLSDIENASNLNQFSRISRDLLTQNDVPYTSPEFYSETEVNRKSDIYSFGVVMLETFFPEIFEQLRQMSWTQKRAKKEFDSALVMNRFNNIEFLDTYGPRDPVHIIFGLIKKCMSRKPRLRPTIPEIRLILRRVFDQFALI